MWLPAPAKCASKAALKIRLPSRGSCTLHGFSRQDHLARPAPPRWQRQATYRGARGGEIADGVQEMKRLAAGRQAQAGGGYGTAPCHEPSGCFTKLLRVT